jgi:alkyl hydroperoxide reductase subunit D
MSIQNLKDKLPEYAKDLKLNLSSILNAAEGMSEQQLWGTLLASALASRNSVVIQEVAEEAAEHLDAQANDAAKTAAAIMAMNNIYYRFIHLVSEKQYGTMPAKLRMNALVNPGVDKADFELWSLAVSAVNGCGLCIDSHEKTLVKQGVDRTVIQHAVRIAAIIHAVAATLEAEEVLA